MSRVSEQMAERLRRTLEKIKGAIKNSEIRVFHNADDTVNAWLIIEPSKRISVRQAMIDIEQETSKLVISKTWISVGYRLIPRDKDDLNLYDRFMGLIEAFTNPRRNTVYGKALAFTTSATVWKHMRNAGFKRPRQIVVKVYFDSKGRKPHRSDM